MSANFYYRYLLSISGQTQKEPFFSRAWGKANIKSREAARQTVLACRAHNVEEASKRYQEVLGGFNARINDEHLAILNALAEDTLAFLDAQKRAKMRRLQELRICTESMQRVMGDIVELLHPYAALMNRAMGKTALYTVTTGPEQVTEAVRNPSNPELVQTRTEFRARFSTCTWSLLFRGTENRISVYLIPADMVLRLNKVESTYRPVAQLRSRLEGNRVEWSIDGQPLDRENFEFLCISLYHSMLERSQALVFAEDTEERTQQRARCAMPDQVSGVAFGAVGDIDESGRRCTTDCATVEVPRFDGPVLGGSEPFLFTGDQCDASDEARCKRSKRVEKPSVRQSFDCGFYLLTEDDFRDEPQKIEPSVPATGTEKDEPQAQPAKAKVSKPKSPRNASRTSKKSSSAKRNRNR